MTKRRRCLRQKRPARVKVQRPVKALPKVSPEPSIRDLGYWVPGYIP